MVTTPFQNSMLLGGAMFILLLSVVIIVLGIILIHELPYRIARRRGHPQQDAIRCMAIMGLILIPLWLLAMIWAYMRSDVSCFGGKSDKEKLLTDEIITSAEPNLNVSAEDNVKTTNQDDGIVKVTNIGDNSVEFSNVTEIDKNDINKEDDLGK